MDRHAAASQGLAQVHLVGGIPPVHLVARSRRMRRSSADLLREQPPVLENAEQAGRRTARLRRGTPPPARPRDSVSTSGGQQGGTHTRRSLEDPGSAWRMRRDPPPGRPSEVRRHAAGAGILGLLVDRRSRAELDSMRPARAPPAGARLSTAAKQQPGRQAAQSAAVGRSPLRSRSRRH